MKRRFIDNEFTDENMLSHANVNGIVFRTGQSVKFPYTRNTVTSKLFGKGRFQTYIEPSGRYMIFDYYPDEESS